MQTDQSKKQYKNFMKRKKLPKVKKEKSDLFKYGSIVLASIGLLIPAFYLFGLRFYEGILEAYGISIVGFSLDTIEVYVNGYYAVVFVVFEYLTNYINLMKYIFIALGVFIVIYVGYRLIKSKWMRKDFTLLTDSQVDIDKGSATILEWVIKLFYILTMILSFIAVLGILWIKIPQWSYDKGQYSQSQNIRMYHEKGCYFEKNDWNNCVEILDQNDSKIYEGLLVAIKGDKIALYQKNGSRVITLKPSDKVYRSKSVDSNSSKN